MHKQVILIKKNNILNAYSFNQTNWRFSRINEKGIKLNVTDAFKERLVEEGYNPSYGARPLRRAVMRLLEDSLAEEVLSGRIKDGDVALVDVDENKKVTVKISPEESPQELAGANF